jgi:hypothetical protein
MDPIIYCHYLNCEKQLIEIDNQLYLLRIKNKN